MYESTLKKSETMQNVTFAKEENITTTRRQLKPVKEQKAHQYFSSKKAVIHLQKDKQKRSCASLYSPELKINGILNIIF